MNIQVPHRVKNPCALAKMTSQLSELRLLNHR